MPERPRNVGASVRQRLLNLADARGQPMELLLTRYALERLLHRLSLSPHRERFVLMGPMLLATWSTSRTGPPGMWTCSAPCPGVTLTLKAAHKQSGAGASNKRREMRDNEATMATAEQLKALLRSHAEGDDRHFFAVAMQMAAHEAKQGHGRLAEELRELIDAAKARRPANGSVAPIPLTRPKGELAGLLSVSYPTQRLGQMVLAPAVAKSLQRVLKEQRHISKLQGHGLHPRRKLLLVGPSGTGKTMTAAALAGELGIALFVVRLDALITKFMGETAAKLRQVFDAVKLTRGVYFFDEFDAIGGHRGLTNDVGEIRRILNSFLLMIEQDDSNSVIVAATNHPEILDQALFRRFDDVIEYHVPTSDETRELFRVRLGKYLRPAKRMDELVSAATGLSHAEITRAISDCIKDAVMADQDTVAPEVLIELLAQRQQVRQRTPSATRP